MMRPQATAAEARLSPPLQELLAAQLIQALAHIFRESALPLYLRPYEARTAFHPASPPSHCSLHPPQAESHPTQ